MNQEKVENAKENINNLETQGDKEGLLAIKKHLDEVLARIEKSRLNAEKQVVDAGGSSNTLNEKTKRVDEQIEEVKRTITNEIGEDISNIEKPKIFLQKIEKLEEALRERAYPMGMSRNGYLKLSEDGSVADVGDYWKGSTLSVLGAPGAEWKSSKNEDSQVMIDQYSTEAAQKYQQDKENLSVLKSPVVDKFLFLAQKKGGIPELRKYFSENNLNGKLGNIFVVKGNGEGINEWLLKSKNLLPEIEKVLNEELLKKNTT